MQNKLFLLFSVFLFISLASAQVSINPSSVSINAFPNENIQQNLTITSDGTYALILNISDGIIVSPSPLIVNAGENNVTVIFHIPSNISSGIFSETLTASIEVPDSVTNSGNSNSGNSGSNDRIITIYKNRDKIIYTDNPNPKNPNNSPGDTSKITGKIISLSNFKKNPTPYFFIFAFAIILVLIIFLNRKKFLKGGNKEK